jgi:hypothetical protein
MTVHARLASVLWRSWAAVLISGLWTTTNAQIPTLFPDQTLVAPGHEPVAAFDIALDGDTLVTAPSLDEYRRSGAGDWVWHSQLPKPPVGTSAFDDIAVHGDVALVSDRVGFQGIVHSYKRDLGSWHYVSTIVCPDPTGFSIQLDIDDGYAVIGAQSPLFSAYVYRVDQSGRLTLDTRLVPGQFSFAGLLAIAGQTIMVGTLEPDNHDNHTAVRIYSRTHGAWTEQQILDPHDFSPDVFFGPITLDKNRAFIGSETENFHGEPDQGGLPSAGVVREFVRIGGQWVMRAELESPDTFNGFFGHRLALDGNRLLVDESGGATAQNPFGQRVFLYERIGHRWQLKGQLVISTELNAFVSIAIDDHAAVIGAGSTIVPFPAGTFAFDLRRLHRH